MNQSLAEIRTRRGILLERARAERAEIGMLFERPRAWLGMADAGLAAGRFLLRQKRLLVVGALAFAIVRPRRALLWGWETWRFLRFVRKVRRALSL